MSFSIQIHLIRNITSYMLCYVIFYTNSLNKKHILVICYVMSFSIQIHLIRNITSYMLCYVIFYTNSLNKKHN